MINQKLWDDKAYKELGEHIDGQVNKDLNRLFQKA